MKTYFGRIKARKTAFRHPNDTNTVLELPRGGLALFIQPQLLWICEYVYVKLAFVLLAQFSHTYTLRKVISKLTSKYVLI